MIVRTMSKDEVFSEAEQDFENVDRYIFNNVKKYARMMIKSRNKHIDYVFKYTSPMKNNWLINIKMDKKDFVFVGVIYDSDNNYYMLTGDRKTLIHYSPHFISRFNERFLNGSCVNTFDVMKNFIPNNNRYSSKGNGFDNQIFVVTEDGVCFGKVYGDKKGRIYKVFKTFINFDMLRSNQADDTIDGHNYLNQYKEEILKEYQTVL